jgi:hypothetical protein
MRINEALAAGLFEVRENREMPDTHCAMHWQRSKALPRACAIISCSLDTRAEFSFVFREAKRNTTMMSADRSKLSCRALLFLFVLIGVPSLVRSSTLEDSAKDLARKIAAVLPAGENVSCEIRNVSSLKPGEAARIEQALKAELQERGIRLIGNGGTTTVVVTLSENLRDLVWTGEIHQGDASQVILVDVDRLTENRPTSIAMPVAIHSEKFWEGPERILDAGEISDGAGKSWLVLLRREGLLIEDKQTGSAKTLEIASNQSASRDPWGNLHFELIGNAVAFFLSPRVCTVKLETPNLNGCLPAEGSLEAPPDSSVQVMFDVAPSGPPLPGKGTEVEMKSVCGSASQFLATGGRDYTQTDSLQVFQTESSGAVAVSSELDFPGPITALHAGANPPRAVVRNLTTGNYEAYRLSFSCGQ